MRLFFAVLLPEELIARVSAVQAEMRAAIGDDGVRWTQPAQFHYTLRFLGELNVARAELAVDAARGARADRPPFTLTLGGVGAFPNNARPGTLWLGATAGGEEMADLAAQLEAGLTRRHFPRENRPLNAHLTLARVKGYAGEVASARALRSLEVGEIGSVEVDRFALMRSTLKPTGSEYTLIEEFML